MTIITPKWQERFILSAKQKSSYSKDPSTQIGAVAVNPETMIELSSGWNGFPRGIHDSSERLMNRTQKFQYTVHGEMNCIYNATHNGISLKGSHLFVYGLPVCSRCALGVIQVGIVDVTCLLPKKKKHQMVQSWLDEWSMTKELFNEAGIDFRLIETVGDLYEKETKAEDTKPCCETSEDLQSSCCDERQEEGTEKER